MKKEVYYAKWKCSNCKAGYPYDDNFAVPKGVEFKEFAKSKECPRCGCAGTVYFYGLASGH